MSSTPSGTNSRMFAENSMRAMRQRRKHPAHPARGTPARRNRPDTGHSAISVSADAVDRQQHARDGTHASADGVPLAGIGRVHAGPLTRAPRRWCAFAEFTRVAGAALGDAGRLRGPGTRTRCARTAALRRPRRAPRARAARGSRSRARSRARAPGASARPRRAPCTGRHTTSTSLVAIAREIVWVRVSAVMPTASSRSSCAHAHEPLAFDRDAEHDAFPTG